MNQMDLFGTLDAAGAHKPDTVSSDVSGSGKQASIPASVLSESATSLISRGKGKVTSSARRLQDFGDYVPGARKDANTLTAKDIADLTDTQLREYVSNGLNKSDIWPRPKAEGMKAAGYTPEAYMLHRDTWLKIAPKPNTHFRGGPTVDNYRAYSVMVKNIRESLEAFNTAKGFNDFLRSLIRKKEDYVKKEFEKARQSLKERYPERDCRNMSVSVSVPEYVDSVLLFGVPPDTSIEDTDCKTFFGSNPLTHSYLLGKKKHTGVNYEDIVTLSGHFAAKEITSPTTWDEVIASENVATARRQARAAVSSPTVVETESTSSLAAEARLAYAPQTADEFRSIREGLKPWFADDYMLSEAEFLTLFKIGGGQFGNWVNGDERQSVLLSSARSFLDMSEIMGLPPASLGLGGRLNYAWGARGRGRAAAAHYEPMLKVINLTKTAGAGSFAHEWAHALDHMLFDAVIASGVTVSGATTFLSDVLQDNKAKLYPNSHVMEGLSRQDPLLADLVTATSDVVKSLSMFKLSDYPDVVDALVDRLYFSNGSFVNGFMKKWSFHDHLWSWKARTHEYDELFMGSNITSAERNARNDLVEEIGRDVFMRHFREFMKAETETGFVNLSLFMSNTKAAQDARDWTGMMDKVRFEFIKTVHRVFNMPVPEKAAGFQDYMASDEYNKSRGFTLKREETVQSMRSEDRRLFDALPSYVSRIGRVLGAVDGLSRQAFAERFFAVRRYHEEAIVPSRLVEDAKAERTRTKQEYYGRAHERFARGFESIIQFALAEKGAQNSFLVSNALDQPHHLDTPEAASIAPTYARFFKALRLWMAENPEFAVRASAKASSPEMSVG